MGLDALVLRVVTCTGRVWDMSWWHHQYSYYTISWEKAKLSEVILQGHGAKPYVVIVTILAWSFGQALLYLVDHDFISVSVNTPMTHMTCNINQIKDYQCTLVGTRMTSSWRGHCQEVLDELLIGLDVVCPQGETCIKYHSTCPVIKHDAPSKRIKRLCK